MGSLAHIKTMVKKVTKSAAPRIEFPRSAVEKKPRTFSIGGDILPPKRNLTRFVKWPKYVRLQRSKMTLLKRIKIPPAINQFSNTFDQRQASQVFRLLNNLKPETKTEKKERLAEQAEKVAAGGKAAAKKPVAVKMGMNHVTSLIEEKKAKLVVIAHDVKPENRNDLQSLITLAEANFNNVYEDHMRKWGDAQLSGRQMASQAARVRV